MYVLVTRIGNIGAIAYAKTSQAFAISTNNLKYIVIHFTALHYMKYPQML